MTLETRPASINRCETLGTGRPETNPNKLHLIRPRISVILLTIACEHSMIVVNRVRETLIKLSAFHSYSG